MRSSSYRFIYLGLGAALIAIVLLGIAFGSPDSGGGERPEVLEQIYPEPGSRVTGLDPLEVDVPPEYVVSFWIDFRGTGSSEANWVRVPESEITVVAATGVHSWQPGPDRTFERWPVGNQRVRVEWDTTVGLADAGRYDWSFRVTG